MRTIIVTLLSSVMFMGCSSPFGGSHSEIAPGHEPGVAPTPQPGVALKGATSGEFVASGTQPVSTSGGRFKVQATLGGLAKNIRAVTASRSYDLRSNGQGQILLEEVR